MTELDTTRTPVQLFSKRLTHVKFSQAIIEDLNKIKKVNKKSLKESYLLNSYIINLVASWQIFVEELARYALIKMISKNKRSNLNIILINNYEERIKKFNTPNSNNIDILFKSVLGIEKITKHLDQKNERKKIDEILSIRHSIAHTGYSTVELSVATNFKRMEILMKVATNLEEIVKKHI